MTLHMSHYVHDFRPWGQMIFQIQEWPGKFWITLLLALYIINLLVNVFRTILPWHATILRWKSYSLARKSRKFLDVPRTGSISTVIHILKVYQVTVHEIWKYWKAYNLTTNRAEFWRFAALCPVLCSTTGLSRNYNIIYRHYEICYFSQNGNCVKYNKVWFTVLINFPWTQYSNKWET